MSEKCKYQKSCGSCQFLNVEYSQQLVQKQEIAQSNLKGVDCPVLPTIGNFYPYKYRNKLHLAFAKERGKTSIGFYQEESKKVVDIDSCILHDDWAKKLIAVLRKYISASKIDIFNSQNQTGNLRYAVARFLDNSLMLTLVIYQKFITGLDFLYADLLKEFSQVGIYLNVNQTKTSAVFSNVFIHKKGIKKQDAKMLGVHFQLMPQTFYQINQGIATKIYTHVISLLQAKKGQIALDLYSGIGISTMLLAKSGAQIISVEVVPESVAEAKRLASANNITNIKFFCGKCEDILPTLSQTLAPTTPNTLTPITQNAPITPTTITPATTQIFQALQSELIVFLDPPRKGCGEMVIKTLLNLNPTKIIYLSCNPATLAEDLVILTTQYTVTLIQPYDMFPQTKHVETLVCLVCKN